MGPFSSIALVPSMIPSIMLGFLLVFTSLNQQTHRHVLILSGFLDLCVFWVHREIKLERIEHL